MYSRAFVVEYLPKHYKISEHEAPKHFKTPRQHETPKHYKISEHAIPKYFKTPGHYETPKHYKNPESETNMKKMTEL